jgi:hypothetical protein
MAKKKKMYRVLCTMETDLYLDVEASSREEAMEIAQNTDGGDFIEDGGSWNVYDAVVITKKDML